MQLARRIAADARCRGADDDCDMCASAREAALRAARLLYRVRVGGEYRVHVDALPPMGCAGDPADAGPLPRTTSPCTCREDAGVRVSVSDFAGVGPSADELPLPGTPPDTLMDRLARKLQEAADIEAELHASLRGDDSPAHTDGKVPSSGSGLPSERGGTTPQAREGTAATGTGTDREGTGEKPPKPRAGSDASAA
eukprot:gene26893-38158_t